MLHKLGLSKINALAIILWLINFIEVDMNPQSKNQMLTI